MSISDLRSRKIKIKRMKIRDLLFYLLIITYCLTASDTPGVSGSMYKYLVLVIGIIEEYFTYHRRKSKKNFKPKVRKEFKYLLFFIFIICIYSVFKMMINMHFSFRVIQEILFLICPMIYAYFFINNSSKEEVRDILKIGFIITFFLYIISLEMNFNQVIYSLKNSSFAESSSNLESGVYSGLSLAFSIFFIYDNKSKLYRYSSLLFVFMTFKRFSIIIVIIMYFISLLNVKDKKVPKKIYILSGIFIFLLSIGYYQMILPKNVCKIEAKYNIDVSKITMTRSDRLNVLNYSNYESYGFGSSNEYMYLIYNGALEMDFIRMFIEVGYIPVLILIFTYIYICKNNMYSMIFTFLKLISMIFSSCLLSTISWTITFIILFTLNKKEEQLC